MRQRLGILTAVALACAMAATLAAANTTTTSPKASSPAAHHPPKPVTVNDNYYSPTQVSVPKYGKVRWTWKANDHNVTLYKAPTGVRKSDFRSATASVPFTFTRKFEKRGTYKFHCTIHPIEMQMTVKVGQ